MQQAINSNQDLQIAPVCIVYKLNIFSDSYLPSLTPIIRKILPIKAAVYSPLQVSLFNDDTFRCKCFQESQEIQVRMWRRPPPGHQPPPLTIYTCQSATAARFVKEIWPSLYYWVHLTMGSKPNRDFHILTPSKIRNILFNGALQRSEELIWFFSLWTHCLDNDSYFGTILFPQKSQTSHPRVQAGARDLVCILSGTGLYYNNNKYKMC